MRAFTFKTLKFSVRLKQITEKRRKSSAAIHLLDKWKNAWMRNYGALKFVCLLEVMLNTHSEDFPYCNCECMSRY